MKQIIYLSIAVTLCCCTKHNANPGRYAQLNPFQKYIQENSSAVGITLHPNDLPVEIGYGFSTTIDGTVIQLGVRLPDSGKTYTVSLWDGNSQAALKQININVLSQSAFTYVDLTGTNDTVHIQANHPYVLSVNMIPVGVAGSGGNDFFDARRNDQADIFPLSESPVTYQYQCNKTTYTPAFPDNVIIYKDVINGLVDIGFRYVSQ